MSDGTSCLKCNRPSVTFIRYSGAHLCSQHFQEFFIKRVKKEIRGQHAFSQKGRIAVALSGGKDSVVALKTLADVARDHRGVELEAIIINEGLKGYRPSSIEIARQVCSELEVPLHEVSFKEHTGLEMDRMADKIPEVNPCALCGVFRRSALNTKAREIGALKIATGHNLDDLAQSIFMNVLNADMDKLFRLGPHSRTITGLVPRFYPLRTIPEKEVLLYSLLCGLPVHAEECPYSVEATRGRYRDILATVETDNPGTKHSLLNFHRSIVKLRGEAPIEMEQMHCETCDEPSASKVCKRCQYQKMVDEVLKRNFDSSYQI